MFYDLTLRYPLTMRRQEQYLCMDCSFCQGGYGRLRRGREALECAAAYREAASGKDEFMCAFYCHTELYNLYQHLVSALFMVLLL
jgi:hypothetical protein